MPKNRGKMFKDETANDNRNMVIFYYSICLYIKVLTGGE